MVYRSFCVVVRVCKSDVCLLSTYLLFPVLTAGSVSDAERGDGENCYPAHQRQRKRHKGTGKGLVDCVGRLKSH